MSKRDATLAGLDAADDGDGEDARPKRHRKSGNSVSLARLSPELLLRILSYLSAVDLVTSRRVSRDFNRLAGDSQLWKSLYYNRFVRPRASRLPGIHECGGSTVLHYSSKRSKWRQTFDH